MMGTASVHGTHGLRRLALALGAIVVLCLALAAKAPAAYVGATDAAAPASIANGASTGYTLDFEGTTVSRTTPTDVVLVFDESSSISAADFSKERAFATDIVNSLDVFLDGGTVGVVQFSTDARQTLAPTSIRQSAINRIAVMSQRGGNTCIGCGIQAAQQMFQPLGSGRRRVQIVLTDGLDNVNTNTLASIVTAAKGDGEELFAIGVGAQTDQQQLNTIASEPDSTHAYNVASFSDLDAITQSLVAAVAQPAETNITWAFDVADAFAASNVQVTKGSWTLAGQTLTWTIPALAAETARLSFTATHRTAAGCGDMHVLNSSAYQSAQNSTTPVLTRGPVTVTGCDQTKPTATITAPVDGAKIPQGDDVKAAYACADEQGGSGVDTCVGDMADGASIDTAALSTKTFSVAATDKAGNTHTETVSYTVVDVTKPTAKIDAPVDGAQLAQGDVVKAAFSCADEAEGSGLGTCVGDVADGASIDTATPGTKSFSVAATDKAGNTHTQTVSYTVDSTPPVITPAITGPTGATGAGYLPTPTPGSAVAVAATVAGLHLSPATFRAARSGPSATTAATGTATRVSYSLNIAASARFTVQLATSGRSVTGRCVKPTSSNRTHKSCTRYVAVSGSFTRTRPAGADRFTFTGRLGGHPLTAGRYRLVATPAADGYTGTATRASFRIIK
jgi:hypothetical protein